MTRLKLITGFDAGFAEVAALTVPRLEALARKHGYSFEAESNLSAAPNHPCWVKIPHLQAHLDDSCDYVMWVDADVLVVRDDVDIRDFFRDEHDVWMAWHYHPQWTMRHPNDGVIVFRNCEWSHRFLERVWALRETFSFPWYEQSAMHHLFGMRVPPGEKVGRGRFEYQEVESEDRRHLGVLPAEWNTLPYLADTDDPIMHHYAGISHHQRLEWIVEDLRSLEDRISTPERRKNIVRLLHHWMGENYVHEKQQSLRHALRMFRNHAPEALHRRIEFLAEGLLGYKS